MKQLRIATFVAVSLLAASAHADPVAGSFARMLAHQPTAVMSPAPAGTDPLIAALVEPLRNSQPSRTMPPPTLAGGAVRR